MAQPKYRVLAGSDGPVVGGTGPGGGSPGHQQLPSSSPGESKGPSTVPSDPAFAPPLCKSPRVNSLSTKEEVSTDQDKDQENVKVGESEKAVEITEESDSVTLEEANEILRKKIAEANDYGITKPPRTPEKPLLPYVRSSHRVWDSVKAENPDPELWGIGKVMGQMGRELPGHENRLVRLGIEAKNVGPNSSRASCASNSEPPRVKPGLDPALLLTVIINKDRKMDGGHRHINESEFLSMAPMLPMDPAFMLVADFFRRKHVHVTSNWIRECIRFCKQESLVPPGSTIDKAVYVQWMIADIRHPGVQDYSIRLRRLPDLGDPVPLNTSLPAGAIYSLQVLSAMDIGTAAYTQAVKLVGADKHGNSAVDSDATQQNFTANWEPKPGRMLKIWLTDGQRTIWAVEAKPIPLIHDQISPGYKLSIRGPAAVRRGHIMLEPWNVQPLGGATDNTIALSHHLQIRMGQVPLDDSMPEPNCDQPTQTFEPKGLATKYKSSISGTSGTRATYSRERRPLANRSKTKNTRELPGMLPDEDDAFLASIDIASSDANNDVFGDDDDELFSQINIPNESAAPKRRKL